MRIWWKKWTPVKVPIRSYAFWKWLPTNMLSVLLSTTSPCHCIGNVSWTAWRIFIGYTTLPVFPLFPIVFRGQFSIFFPFLFFFYFFHFFSLLSSFLFFPLLFFSSFLFSFLSFFLFFTCLFWLKLAMDDFVYVFDAWRKWSCGVVCVWPRTNSDTIISMFIWFFSLEGMIYGGKLIWCDPLTSKIYQVEGKVLVSVLIFVNKINTYRLKRW